MEDISSKIEAQEDTIKQQNKAIEKLIEEVQQLKGEQDQSRSWLDKVKDIFS